MSDGFLQIDMLAHTHGVEGLDSVVMVGCGDTHGIEMLTLLVVHLPKVIEIFRFWIGLAGIDRYPIIYVAQVIAAFLWGVFIKLPKSAAPIPPQPILAMYNLSLGGTCPRPDMVKLGRIVRAAIPVADSPKKSLRESLFSFVGVVSIMII